MCRQVEDLTTPLHCMNAETLNVWLSRFVEEVCNAKGERYPGRTVYVIICGLKQYLSDKSGLDPLCKDDKRSTSSYTIGPVFNNCVFNSYDCLITACLILNRLVIVK